MIKHLVKRMKRSNTIFYFNKWFEKEHDYCLPIKKNSEVSLVKHIVSKKIYIM